MTSQSVPASGPADDGSPLLRGEVAFRLLVDAVQDYAIFLLGPDGHVLTWNRGAQRIKGYTADEIIGQHFSRFYTPEERDAGRPMRLLGWAAKHGRFEDEGWRVRKDGSRFWADVIVTALRDESGVPYAYAKVTRDLTERKAAEEQERRLLAEQEARAAAEEALRARDRFLTIASHELKTPVATVQLAVESVLRARVAGRLHEDRLEAGMRRILSGTHRLGELLGELLDISRLTAEELPIDAAEVDLVPLAAEVVARFADLAPSPDSIRLVAPASAVVVGDRSRIDQVITNLVDNAVKYSNGPPQVQVRITPAGEGVELVVGDRSRIDQVITNLVDNAVKYSNGPPQVQVRITPAGEGVELVVVDRGPGLDAVADRRMFEAFERGTDAANTPGLGLGLHIARTIVERHGGRIAGRRREDGPGAAFTVWLPRGGEAAG